MDNISPLLVLVGETASGKSALALKLAQKFNGEIICADSGTVRREVNIGTAKPTNKEQKLVRHHLLDIVEPDADFTSAVFKDLAFKAIKDIASRGKLPIMVGGTGLYIDGVIYNFGFLPAGNRAQRPEFNALSIEDLQLKVQALGISLKNIDSRNKRRLIRLIETKGAMPTRHKLRRNTLIIGLKTERKALRQRIEERVDIMIGNGLEIEVKSLAKLYGWDCEALKGVGYAQWLLYFKGDQSLEETRDKIIKTTLDLAKRQRTWFQRNKSIHWLSTPVNWRITVDLVTSLLDK